MPLPGSPPPERPRAARRAVAAFDAAVEARVARWRTPALDHVCYPLSSAADHGLLWLALAAVRGARRGGGARPVLRFAAALGVESFVTNVVVKSLFGRIRPRRPVTTGPLPYGLHVPVTSSFPSGHATTAFCAATLLRRGPRDAPAWYGLAAAVAATRVYVRMHHASDALAGSVLGLVLGTALRRALPPVPPIRSEHP